MQRNRVEFICEMCGVKAEQKKSVYGKSEHHFCSAKCHALWMNKKVESVCEVCGRTVLQKKSVYDKHEHHYCSPECGVIGRSNLSRENRLCEYCGKPFNVTVKSPQRFCSYQCQHEWQKTRTGNLSPNYTRKKTICKWCGKEFELKNSKASNGQNHFCCKECRQAWYANIWSQDKEWKEVSRDRAVSMLSAGKMTHTNTTPQKIVNELLDEMNVGYINEKPWKGFSIDNCLLNGDLYIEVMGDYWHCSPVKYKKPINDVQLKTIGRDIRKMQAANEEDKHILYLWERDIMRRTEVCKALIKLFIENKGELENYHSFNYSLDKKGALIKQVVAIPFQERLNLTA